MAEGCNSKCGICKSCFIEPKLLDCYHTFCSPCLQKLDVRDSKIVCPLCKTNISLPDNGVSGLKPYPFKLEYLTEPNAVMDSCELCDEQNVAMATCLECKIKLCSNCRNYHGKLKASKNHTVEPLKKLKSEEVDQSGANNKNKCKDHGKEFSFFCKPCNCLLCIECSEDYHRRHQFKKLSSLLQTKKEKLLVRIASFKSRISFLHNTAEIVRLKEINYDKHCLVLKQDVNERAASLKDRFCSTVEEIKNKNLDTIDNIKTEDIKELKIFRSEIETGKMSLLGLVMITEDFVNNSSDANFLNEFPVIGKHLDNVLDTSANVFPPTHDLNFEWNDVTEDVIEEIFGKVTARAKNNETTPNYPQLSMPDLGLACKSLITSKKIFEFKLENNIQDIVPAENDNAWILTDDTICNYSCKGIFKTNNYTLPYSRFPKRTIRKSANDIWIWSEGSIFDIKESKHKKRYEVPFKNCEFCCVVSNGNLLVLNEKDDRLYELSEKDGVFNNVEVADSIKNKYNIWSTRNVTIKQTNNSNFVISFCRDFVHFTDKHFKVLKTFTKNKAEFKAIASDNHGNVFLADSKNGIVYMLFDNGNFQQNLLSQNDDVCNTTNMIVDECGNLWLVGSSKSIQVFAYQ
ncbi:transcription intermediary factor 1-beta-like [Mytilus edulis]|uniref:transcription intermediary factor 1-beta-like n=1 Tax=Mytilus edulis TaxID=6550 RepID=UPI0039EDF18C